MNKPFAPACERNQQPIYSALREWLADGPQRILEIGSGTGQHGVFFTAQEPRWHWQCSDRRENLPGIGLWVKEATRPNLPTPLCLDVDHQADWEAIGTGWDWIYTANSLHIMSWNSVKSLFARLPGLLKPTTGLLIYGPFNREGAFTSPSNAAFDQHLRQQDPAMGIRHLEEVLSLANSIGLALAEARPMPANNFLLRLKPAG